MSDAVRQIGSELVDVARLIESSHGKVVVIGSGTSGMVARRLAHLLSVSGTPAFFVHPMDGLHGTMGSIEPEDVVIAISKGGESDEVNRLCAIQKRKGSVIVGVGEKRSCSLARECDVFVALTTLDGADPANTLAMGSSLVAALWGDALARALMEIHDWQVADSLAIHPAGAVGKSSGLMTGLRSEDG
ncbi:SIS domain-containing protein [Actinomyces ruminis]|uniref:SIS domain-containing protein n=1 Tax=Actinomyces ruminis TaxID=1937003 RepID=UPI0015D480A0|nr:SIS domain-containing protein [Actinomyces ruminis]